VAGLVDGAFGIGAAIGAPLQSRVIDRLGQRRVLLPLAVVDGAATAVLVALTETGAPTGALMALLILPAGLLIAPLGAALDQLVGEVAPAGAKTEAYAWPVTALLAGFAGGTAVGGSLVESLDWHACFVAASLAATLGAVLAYTFRRTLAVPGLAKPESVRAARWAAGSR
jgi:MFS family permease